MTVGIGPDDDDMDPLAPVHYDDPAPELTDSVPAEGLDAEDGPHETDGGTADSENIVRVWLEDGRLTKVRVAPTWASKLGKRSLSEPFRQAFAMANARIANPPAPPEEDHTLGVDMSRVPPFSNRTFSIIRELFDEVEQRWEDAIARHQARPRAEVATVEGRAKGVTVGLNEAGRVDRVTFDPKWLDTAQAGQICSQVQAAADDAYAKFVPAVEDRSELDEIEAQHKFLMATFQAMLNPKERR